MDIYALLRYLHYIGFIFIGGGLLAVWVSEWRAYGATRTVIFTEAAFYTATLYDYVVVPGALLVLTSGPLMIWQSGLGYFAVPWLTAMWLLFLFEFTEGNTITRLQFRRTLRMSRRLSEDAPVTEEVRREARTFIGRLAHFLDIPLFSVIVYCGVARPDTWNRIGVAIGIAIPVALLLMFAVPRVAESLARGSGVGSGAAVLAGRDR